MNRKLIRKYEELKKLNLQKDKLNNKIDNVELEIKELEKTEIYKDFLSMDISLQEYKEIVEKKINQYQGKEDIEFNEE
ncbi:hypothetical protein [Gudongella sp. SC589]|uniref:hypothetical protein n=1 Tax=Gudongella sp. SC589 TaxID=3385990 RepID=UPI003904C3B0